MIYLCAYMTLVDNRHIDGFGGVNGGYAVGQKNCKRKMLLEF